MRCLTAARGQGHGKLKSHQGEDRMRPLELLSLVLKDEHHMSRHLSSMTAFHLYSYTGLQPSDNNKPIEKAPDVWSDHRMDSVLEFTEYLSTIEQGDNALGSVRLYVRLFVCLSELSSLNRLTFDLDFRHSGSTFPSAAMSNKSHYSLRYLSMCM